jgi:hypothetical protein
LYIIFLSLDCCYRLSNDMFFEEMYDPRDLGNLMLVRYAFSVNYILRDLTSGMMAIFGEVCVERNAVLKIQGDNKWLKTTESAMTRLRGLSRPRSTRRALTGRARTTSLVTFISSHQLDFSQLHSSSSARSRQAYPQNSLHVMA